MLLQQTHTDLHTRKAVLDALFSALHNQFVGQGQVIDEVKSLIMPWFLFPEAQERPLVVNLWGLTGTGKTSLVKAIARGLDMMNAFVHLDMGEFAGDGQNSSSLIKMLIKDDIAHFSGKPCILCLDEFQFARTLNENGGELNKDGLRVIWELLDTGMIEFVAERLTWVLSRGEALLRRLKMVRQAGIQLLNGVVSGDLEFFSLTFEGFVCHRFNSAPVLPGAGFFTENEFLSLLEDLVNEEDMNFSKLKSKVCELNLAEFIQWIESLLRRPRAMENVNLSKALIFVTGNLDEAYPMSSLLDPEVSADDLHKATQRIHLPQIKQALKRRFRNEQIARLGNNHVIYHSLPSAAFREFISRELHQRSDKVKGRFGIALHFDASVHDVLYSEGVYPAQGLRPLLTTINNFIDGCFGQVLLEAAQMPFAVHAIHWHCADSRMEFRFLDETGKEHSRSCMPLLLKLETIRQSTNKEVQAHTAVHEAGHALVAALTTRLLPSVVVSNSASGDMQGFCWVEWPEDLETRETLRKGIMVGLGGYLAERMVFGEDHTSSGVVNDLARVSALANRAVKKYGMGRDPILIAFASAGQEDAFAHKDIHAQEALTLVKQCQEEATALLERNKRALLKLAAILTEKNRMLREEIGEVLTACAVEDWVRQEGFISKEEYFSFRDQVFAQLKNLD